MEIWGGWADRMFVSVPMDVLLITAEMGGGTQLIGFKFGDDYN